MDHSAIIDDVLDRGWSWCKDFLTPDEVRRLAAHVRRLNGEGRLRPARIGHRDAEQRDATIRGDAIAWTDASADPELAVIERKLDRLRLDLNRALMLGLFEFEGHFACYPPGAFYRRHLDQFRDSDARRLSCVLYLNPEPWSADDGGALRLYLDGTDAGTHIDFLPEGGGLLVFLSDRFYHEVLPTRRERLSFTGWFRVRE